MNLKEKHPVYLVHGRLGAGKTSVIAHLAKSDYFKRAFVIENEFASENIDAGVLEAHFDNKDIFEISGGCICCTSGAELLEVLEKIAERTTKETPVIIETTGVASAAQLLKQLLLSDLFHQHFYLAKNILVLDAFELSRESLQAWELDIQLADLIVLNKKDLMDTSAFAKLGEGITLIRPEAPYVGIAMGMIDPTILIDGGSSGAEHYLIEHISDIADTLDQNHTQNIQYRVIQAKRATTEKAMREYLGELQERGVSIYRIKGNFIDPDGKEWHIESTTNNTAYTTTLVNRPLKIVVIGKDLPDTLFNFLINI